MVEEGGSSAGIALLRSSASLPGRAHCLLLPNAPACSPTPCLPSVQDFHCVCPPPEETAAPTATVPTAGAAAKAGAVAGTTTAPAKVPVKVKSAPSAYGSGGRK